LLYFPLYGVDAYRPVPPSGHGRLAVRRAVLPHQLAVCFFTASPRRFLPTRPGR